MSGQWRLFLAALRFVTLIPSGSEASADLAPHAARFVPLAGIVVGLIGGAAYWLAAEVWPASIAVVLALLAMVWVTANHGSNATPVGASGASSEVRRDGGLYWAFVLLIKYNALTALSTARAPFALPADLTLGLIMVAGQAASRALVVSVVATETPAMHEVTSRDLFIALLVGLAPALLLGIPGLIGLAAAIIMRLVHGALIPAGVEQGFRERSRLVQQLTEGCFYLGALATWKYI